MQLLDLTLCTPAQNLACDEALLELGETQYDHDILRFWEPLDYFVVLGYTNKILTEVNVAACRERNIPVLRRTSGGGTVVQGPGCLNYSLMLHTEHVAALGGITETNAYIMERQCRALAHLVDVPVEIQGITDLTLQGRKFSGNAQRRKRRCLLFHGTFLLDFDLSLVETLLQMPAKQPAYRDQRTHTNFLTNLGIETHAIKASLKKTWGVAELFEAVPLQRIEQLATEKYAAQDWIHKF